MAIVQPNGFAYQLIPPSSVSVPLGSGNGKSDYLHRLIINTTATATATITLSDGVTSIVLLSGVTGQGIGLAAVEIGMISRNAGWRLTTGAGVTVVAVGVFST